MRMAARIEACGNAPHYAGLTKRVNGNAVWTGKVALAPEDILTQPLRWTKGRKIFVNSMGDLFHESVPDEWIDRVFAVMESAFCKYNGRSGQWIRRPVHTFQILTKRSRRMREYLSARFEKKKNYADKFKDCPTPEMRDSPAARWARNAADPNFYGNIWLGVSAEDQERADERIPDLLATPAAVRFVSAEPLLGPLAIDRYLWPQEIHGVDMSRDFGSKVGGCVDVVPALDWVICGGESGPGARPMQETWAESIRDQCRAAGVAFFMKQMAKKAPIPDDLMVREFPDA